LQDRASDREKFFIAANYDVNVIGNLEKAFTAVDMRSVRCASGEPPSSQSAFCNPSLKLSKLSE
jgi:hypothetical protein